MEVESYPFPAHVTRCVVDILESHIDEYGRSSEEFGMSFCDGSCEGIFLSGREGRIVGDDIKWHVDSVTSDSRL